MLSCMVCSIYGNVPYCYLSFVGLQDNWCILKCCFPEPEGPRIQTTSPVLISKINALQYFQISKYFMDIFIFNHMAFLLNNFGAGFAFNYFLNCNKDHIEEPVKNEHAEINFNETICLLASIFARSIMSTTPTMEQREEPLKQSMKLFISAGIARRNAWGRIT